MPALVLTLNLEDNSLSSCISTHRLLGSIRDPENWEINKSEHL